MIATTVVLALLMAAVSTQAAKDDSYYIAGTGNPNVNEKMYWKDAENVFQDLSQFSSLYVEFHNCAWSWMMASEEDNDIDENDYWYLGKIPPMGANVAYSLYGSLKGESFSGCGEDTFINSFYTNTGFTNFARSMNYAGLSGFSSYSYDDDSSSSYTASCGGGYGVGCDYSNGFAVHSYSGDECNPADYSGVKDTMSSLNKAMKSATCIQIYDSNSYNGSPYGSPLELLAYSHSCFYQDFFSPDGVCPDPYGKLEYYQKNFYQGIQESKKQDPYIVSMRKEQYEEDIEEGKIMSLAGLILIAISLVSMFVEFVSWCCCTKRPARKQVHFDPEESEGDFISTRRSGDQEDTDTEAASSVEGGGYVTMQAGDIEAPSGAYTPPTDVEAPTAAYAPPSEDRPLVETPSYGVDEPQPGKEIQVNVVDQDAPVTLYGPPGKIPVEDPIKTKRERMQSSRKVGDYLFGSQDDEDSTKAEIELPAVESKVETPSTEAPAPATPVGDVNPEAGEEKPEDTDADLITEIPNIEEEEEALPSTEAPVQAADVNTPKEQEEKAETEVVPETEIVEENTAPTDDAAEGEEDKEVTAPPSTPEEDIPKVESEPEEAAISSIFEENASIPKAETEPEEAAISSIFDGVTSTDTSDANDVSEPVTTEAALDDGAQENLSASEEAFTTATELEAADDAVSGEAAKETETSETGSAWEAIIDATKDPILASRDSDSEDEDAASLPKLKTATSSALEGEVEVEVTGDALPSLDHFDSSGSGEEPKAILDKTQSELISEYFDVDESSPSAATEEFEEVKKASTTDEVTSSVTDQDQEEPPEAPKSASWFGW